MAQKHGVEVVIDHEQFLCQLLIADARDELQEPLLHGAASAVELLQGGGDIEVTHRARLLLMNSGQAWRREGSSWNHRTALGAVQACFQDHCSGAAV